MKSKNKPTLIYSVDDLKKFMICGQGNELYINNQISPIIVEGFLEIMSENIKVTIFDSRELQDDGTDLKKNGRVKFKLNKKHTISKQTYYYYSKNRIKYFTTLWTMYIDKNCNYTSYIQNYRFTQSQIFYTSYENTTELINTRNELNISKQSVYLYEKRSCSIFLAKREAELWAKIEKLGIKASGYYHYDEEYIKISGKVYVRLSLIDAHTRIIIKDIIIHKDEFNKEYIKTFLTESLKGLKLNTIITDGYRAYPEIIDELGVKHQLCTFHIMQNLMTPLNKKVRILEKRIESHETKINKKQDKINKLKAEYPYKQGRPPKTDKKATKNLEDRKQLKMEKSELTSQLKQYKKELKELLTYKNKIKTMFRSKTLKTAMNRFNRMWDKKEAPPQIIYDFLKSLSKKINRALEFTQDKYIPKTNNLVELFYKVTFPGKIKRIFRTIEGVENRIRMNNIRWMERNVIEYYEKNKPNQWDFL